LAGACRVMFTTVHSYRQIAAERPNNIRRNCIQTKVSLIWRLAVTNYGMHS